MPYPRAWRGMAWHKEIATVENLSPNPSTGISFLLLLLLVCSQELPAVRDLPVFRRVLDLFVLRRILFFLFFLLLAQGIPGRLERPVASSDRFQLDVVGIFVDAAAAADDAAVSQAVAARVVVAVVVVAVLLEEVEGDHATDHQRRQDPGRKNAPDRPVPRGERRMLGAVPMVGAAPAKLTPPLLVYVAVGFVAAAAAVLIRRWQEHSVVVHHVVVDADAVLRHRVTVVGWIGTRGHRRRGIVARRRHFFLGGRRDELLSRKHRGRKRLLRAQRGPKGTQVRRGRCRESRRRGVRRGRRGIAQAVVRAVVGEKVVGCVRGGVAHERGGPGVGNGRRLVFHHGRDLHRLVREGIGVDVGVDFLSRQRADEARLVRVAGVVPPVLSGAAVCSRCCCCCCWCFCIAWTGTCPEGSAPRRNQRASGSPSGRTRCWRVSGRGV
mmetsp:Transcript_109996/g.224802  ORF Transcript_109996/g.224802 Transcript_109996/m.224802 type:complete len:438 (+) Transcript_109996:854-2167(+)